MSITISLPLGTKAYAVSFKPHPFRPNGSEVSVLALNEKDAVDKALDHLPGTGWTVEAVTEL
jgi:hypothetical protein